MNLAGDSSNKLNVCGITGDLAECVRLSLRESSCYLTGMWDEESFAGALIHAAKLQIYRICKRRHRHSDYNSRSRHPCADIRRNNIRHILGQS